jgi:glycosyl transferase family 25
VASEFALQFERIVVINLESRRDRYAEMGEQLRRAGLSWDSPQVRRFRAVRPADAAGFATVGAHGCFLSHLGALTQAVTDHVQSLLILEDDCNLSIDFEARERTLSRGLAASDWSLFYGGWRLDGQGPLPPSPSGVTAVEAQQEVWLAHCLAMRGEALRAAPAFLRELMSRPAGDPRGGKMDVDGAYNWLRQAHPQFGTCLATPEIAYQRSSASDIRTKWRDRVPLARAAWSMGRRLRNWRHR